jgi:hypothetical protein
MALCFAVGVVPAWAHDFSAERIVKQGKAVSSTHVNAVAERWRLEFARPQWGADVLIGRADREVAWLILSKRRQFVEVPLADVYRLDVDERMSGEQSREFVGDQILNGYPTELFDVEVAQNGTTRHYYRWITKIERFPVKTVSRDGDWSEEYRHLIFTEQSPLLFELPQRLDRASPPGHLHH